MACKAHAGDLCAPQLNATETIKVASSSAKLNFCVICVDNLSQCCVKVELFRVLGCSLEPGQRLLGFLKLANSDQVPWGLWRKTQDGDEESRPNPLQSKGDAVCPLIRAGNKSCQDTGSNQLANDEAHVGPASEEDTKAHGQHLGRVGRRAGNKDAPGQTAQELTNQEHNDVLGEEGNKDEAGQHGQSGNDDGFLAELGDEVSVDEHADEAADLTGVAETGLPGGRQLVAAVFVNKLAVFLGKLWIGVEVAEENSIVACKNWVLDISKRGSSRIGKEHTFHDDTHGNHQAPEDGCWVARDGFPQGQLVCCLVGRLGHEIDLIRSHGTGMLDLHRVGNVFGTLFIHGCKESSDEGTQVEEKLEC